MMDSLDQMRAEEEADPEGTFEAKWSLIKGGVLILVIISLRRKYCTLVRGVCHSQSPYAKVQNSEKHRILHSMIKTTE